MIGGSSGNMPQGEKEHSRMEKRHSLKKGEEKEVRGEKT